MKRIALWLLACGLFATSLPAQETLPSENSASADTSIEVNKESVMTWIRQLDSRQVVQRDEAERRLTEAGPPVLEYLPAITNRTNAEMKERLLRIRSALERLQAQELARASRVTLQGKMTLEEALAAITEQTGNRIIDFRQRLNQPAADTQVTLDLEDVPFWKAFDALADQARVTIYPFVGESRKLAIVAAEEGSAPRTERADYSGLFRIEATNLTSQRNLRATNEDILRLSLELIWEPRVLPILVRQDLEEVEVRTDRGDTLSLQQTGTRQIPIQPGVASLYDVQIPLTLPSREVQELSEVKGKFVALVPGGDVTFEFADLVDGVGKQQMRNGVSVVLDDVRLNQGLQQISLRIRFGGTKESMQSHLDWVENNVVQLIDPRGTPADEPGYERYLERDSEIGFRYIFPVEEKDLTGWKLRYTSPAGVSEIEVPYELKNIPLP